MVETDLELSYAYEPPPIAAPFLSGVIIFKNVVDELSIAINDNALPT